MKTLITILSLTLLLAVPRLWAQNSTCASPSGRMQRPNELTPVCYPGYNVPLTGALTQCYSFDATWPSMYVSLSLNVGTSILCSFPNTAVSYSNFRLYDSLDCGVTLSTTSSWTDLDTQKVYTFCLTMTPVDPICNWIAQACPKANENRQLPVKITSFDISRADTRARLFWETEEELDLRGYAVLFSRDGIEFHEVGFVEAMNNGEESGYSYDHLNTETARSFYKLALTDLDGTVSFSNTLMLNGTEISATETALVYPNPFRGDQVLHLPEDLNLLEIYQLQVFDLQGKRLLAAEGTRDELEIALNGSLQRANPGLYLLQLQSDRINRSAKIKKL
ncbi:MAG: T9SS type A sorting domain-containing protein [Bacteroidia bacterium]|nr:T9SS type A sorting domain-containing protein [Bacteroidia bacterium]